MRAQEAQGEVLRRIADKSMTRDDVAGAYAMALQASGFVQWPTLNRAIINRWSESALHYIKDEAWKRAGSYQDDAPASDPFSGEPGTSSAAGGSWGNSGVDFDPASRQSDG